MEGFEPPNTRTKTWGLFVPSIDDRFLDGKNDHSVKLFKYKFDAIMLAKCLCFVNHLGTTTVSGSTLPPKWVV